MSARFWGFGARSFGRHCNHVVVSYTSLVPGGKALVFDNVVYKDTLKLLIAMVTCTAKEVS